MWWLCEVPASLCCIVLCCIVVLCEVPARLCCVVLFVVNCGVVCEVPARLSAPFVKGNLWPHWQIVFKPSHPLLVHRPHTHTHTHTQTQTHKHKHKTLTNTMANSIETITLSSHNLYCYTKIYDYNNYTISY